MTTERTEREPIAGISSMATRHLLLEVADDYRRRSGWPTTIESVGGVDAVRRVEAGEAFDFVVLADDVIERLGEAGRVERSTRTALARSGIAVAVAAAAPRPDIRSEATVRSAVLQARTIGYSTGPSGGHLKRLFERWGIADSIAPRLVQAPPGIPVATLISRGDVELGFQQLSELMNVPGIDVIGPLPLDIQAITVFSGGICATARQSQAAKALLSFAASAEAGAAKRRHGLEPA
jgi:molybdate transport system substrate-binding protein